MVNKLSPAQEFSPFDCVTTELIEGRYHLTLHVCYDCASPTKIHILTFICCKLIIKMVSLILECGAFRSLNALIKDSC